MSATEAAVKPAPPPKDEAPPAKPPRPMDPRAQAEQTLQEAFPTIDKGVIRAILTASSGQVEPAFAALLEMSDPEAAQREQPPAMPPRPARPAQSPQQSQMESDEQYARQLAEHFQNTETRPMNQNRDNSHLPPSRVGRPGQNPNPDDYQWRSFVDGANDFRTELGEAANEFMTDDLPEIRENIRKGFVETQKTVTSWITNFRKNFNEEDEDVDRTAQNTKQNRGQRSSGEYQRRSADYSRYDADPQVIGDDFSKLDLKDGDHPPRTSSRPVANPNLFRSDRRDTSKGSGRKVSFQDGPPEEIKDMYSSSSKPPTVSAQTTGTTAATTGKTSKWQPLSTVDPSPVGDHDPFSLGDSDDEKDAKPITLQDTENDKKTEESSSKDITPKKATVETEKEKV